MADADNEPKPCSKESEEKHIAWGNNPGIVPPSETARPLMETDINSADVTSPQNVSSAAPGRNSPSPEKK